MTPLNPLGELTQPLHRVEGAIAALSDDLSAIECLPAVHKELEEVNRQLAAVLTALEGLRDDMAGEPAPASANGKGRAAAQQTPAKARSGTPKAAH